jgi:hypothetical protein
MRRRELTERRPRPEPYDQRSPQALPQWHSATLPSPRNGARDSRQSRPSTVSCLSSSLTRAPSPSPLDLRLWPPIFALARSQTEREANTSPRAVAGGDVRTTSPRHFFRTDLSSPEGGARRARHCGPGCCPDKPARRGVASQTATSFRPGSAG